MATLIAMGEDVTRDFTNLATGILAAINLAGGRVPEQKNKQKKQESAHKSAHMG